MSAVNIQRITRPILYMDISQRQPVTAVSRVAANHPEAHPALGTGHDGTFCCSDHWSV